MRSHARGSLSTPGDSTWRQAVAVIYELLDAHDDTARLAGDFAGDVGWQAHLDYLRALQRTGREVLARITAGEGPGELTGRSTPAGFRGTGSGRWKRSHRLTRWETSRDQMSQ